MKIVPFCVLCTAEAWKRNSMVLTVHRETGEVACNSPFLQDIYKAWFGCQKLHLYRHVSIPVKNKVYDTVARMAINRRKTF